jgi:hypothetical protein
MDPPPPRSYHGDLEVVPNIPDGLIHYQQQQHQQQQQRPPSYPIHQAPQNPAAPAYQQYHSPFVVPSGVKEGTVINLPPPIAGKPKKRILGLRKTTFCLIVAVILVVGVAAGTTGALVQKKKGGNQRSVVLFFPFPFSGAFRSEF